MTTVWVEALGFMDLWTLLARSHREPLNVRYDERRCGRLAASTLARLQRLGFCRRFLPAGLDFNLKDSTGHGLLYRMQEDLNACLDAAIDELLGHEPEWLRQSALFYLRERLESRFIFLTSASARADGPSGHEFLVAPHPLNALLIPHYARRGMMVRESIDLPGAVKAFASGLRLPAALLAAALLPRKKPRTDLSRSRPAIWVEHVETRTVDHLFWRAHVRTGDFDVVCYLDRADTPAVERTISPIRASGLHWIDAHPWTLIRLAGPGVTGWTRLVARCLLGRQLWLGALLFECRAWHAIYEDVFRISQVKVLIQHQDRGWKPALQADAVRAAGGIMAGYHWSNLSYLMKSWFLTPQHVYFVWGSAFREYIERKGHSCRHILPSGLWLLPPTEAPARGLADSVAFTLAVFDGDVSYELWQSPATLSQFYLKVLDLLEGNPSWGALIKCKSTDFAAYERLLPEGSAIVGRIRALVAKRRIVVLDPSTSPLSASRGADLTVCYNLNSAGILAGIQGLRAVHWDCVGLKHPLADDAAQKILYPTLDALERAVLAARGGDAEVGDFSRWRRAFDHFGDGAAAARVGEFLNDFMRTVGSNADPLKALDAAAARYAEAHRLDESYFRSGFWKD